MTTDSIKFNELVHHFTNLYIHKQSKNNGTNRSGRTKSTLKVSNRL